MKKYIIAFIMVLAANSAVFSQNSISLNTGAGYYIWNSENSNGIMEHQKYRANLSYGLAFQKEDLFGLNLMLEYSYQQITKKDIIDVEVVRMWDANTIEPVAALKGNAELISHNLDLDYIGRLGIDPFSRNFFYGAGPSFVITNRIFDLYQGSVYNSINHTIYDRLASSGIGLNGFLMYNAPLAEESGFRFTFKLKLRYTHSIWFDKGARNLDDYSQNFLTSEMMMGIGYTF